MFARILQPLLAAAVLATSLVPVASAQANPSWPTRPIRLVVPASAGQGTDILARIVANSLSKSLGQPIVVDNKAGASGMIGNDAVAKAAPDGYTLLFSNASYTVMSHALGQKAPYDLLRDLSPVAQIGLGGVFLVASSDFPAADLKQLVQIARANPGKYQYASFGNGSSGNLIMEALKKQAGIEIGHVPYKSTPQIIQDLQAGLIPLGWVDISTSLPMIKAGRIKALAVSGSQRTPATPQVQTMTDQGYPFNVDGWYGIFAPTGTPREIVDRVNAEVNAATGSRELQDRLITMNIANSPRKTPDQFAATVRDDIKTWTDIVRANGIKPD